MTNTDTKISRKAILPAFLITEVAAIALLFVMTKVQPLLMGNTYLYDFVQMLGGCAENNILYRIAFFFADMTEACFLASMPASVLMCILAFVAAALERKGSAKAGTGVDGNGYKFTGMFCAMVLSLILAQLFFGGFFKNGFILTFCVLLTSQACVVKYGSSPAKVLTSSIVCTPITFILCHLLMTKVISPLGLPLYLSVAYSLVVAFPICIFIFNRLPWMVKADENAKVCPPPAPVSESRFFVNRVLGDIGELTFWGSSLATIGMYAGAILSWILNPMHPSFSAGNFPMVLCTQIITAALAIFIWYPKYKKDGFAFTFTGIVFVSAIVVTYANTAAVIIPTILIGAVIFAPLMDWILKVTKADGTLPGCFYVQLCVGVVCTAWAFVVKAFLI